MKFSLLKSVIAVAIALSGTAVSAVEAPVQVHLYTVHVENISQMIEGNWEFNLSSIEISNALKENQANICIDLRSQGSGSTNGNLSREDIAILTNARLTEATQDVIKAKLCSHAIANSQERCRVSIAHESFNLADLTLNTFVATDSMFASTATPHALAGKPMLPKFSAACDTGRHRDSWNNAVSTPEAQAYVLSVGITLSSVRTIDLGLSNGTRVYTFGFPNHSNTTSTKSASPTTTPTVAPSVDADE